MGDIDRADERELAGFEFYLLEDWRHDEGLPWRVLSDGELRSGLEVLWCRELTEAEFTEARAAYQRWGQGEYGRRVRAHFEQDAKAIAVAQELLSAVNSFVPGDHAAWKNSVNSIIKSKLDDQSLLAVLRISAANVRSNDARVRALKKNTENHALRDQVYAWLDENKTPDMTLDGAADAMDRLRLVPLGRNAVRKHCTSWVKQRPAGIS